LSDGTPILGLFDIDGTPNLAAVDTDDHERLTVSASDVSLNFHHPFVESGTAESLLTIARLWDVEWFAEIVDSAVCLALGEPGAGDILQARRGQMEAGHRASLDLYVQAVRQLPRELLVQMREWTK
jgi:hypothetical protein